MLKTGILIFDVFIIILSVSLIKTAVGWYSLLLLGLYLFPSLRMLRLIPGFDEREKTIDSLSSNMALGISFVLAIFYIGMSYTLTIDAAISFILIPFVAKAVFFSGFTLERRQLVSIIGRSVGLIFVGFALFSHGFSTVALIEMLPGIVIIICTELSPRYRWFGLSYLFLIGIATWVYLPNFGRITSVLVYSLFVIPFSVLLVRSLRCLFTHCSSFRLVFFW
ncbi:MULTISPECIES: hypothetical protein [unclassified Mesotoga]|uniref:hypothetical protein n=1 Tax=unclassified Mesotoga TaxID=1184398 RepID=UPI00117EC84C|nr:MULTISPECIES: hypothetical protein [unclassified Mesotoga]